MKNRNRLLLAGFLLFAVVLTGCLGGGGGSGTTNYTLEMDLEGEGTTDPAKGSHAYERETLVDVKATPAEGWDFYAWVGENGEDVAERFAAETSIVMDDDKQLVALFDRESERVAVVLDSVDLQGATGTVKDLTNNPPYPPGFEVEIEAESEAEDDTFLYWQVTSLDPAAASMGTSNLDPRNYFADYESPHTKFTVPDYGVLLRAVFTKRTPPIEPGEFDYTWEDIGVGIEGTYGVTDHAWDLSGLDTGDQLDFSFTARNIPDRYSVYYGSWDDLETDPDNILVFASGWVSQNPPSFESETVYPEGIQEHDWHEDVDSASYGVWTGGRYNTLITKEADKDVLFIRVESRDQRTIWDYRFDHSSEL